jgi:hypothetical protein
MKTTIIKYKGLEIEMQPIPRSEIREEELICDRCPYNSNCFKFPDPRREKTWIDQDMSFEDFCGELDEDLIIAEGLVEDCQHIPVPGSLEKVFGELPSDLTSTES